MEFTLKIPGSAARRQRRRREAQIVAERDKRQILAIAYWVMASAHRDMLMWQSPTALIDNPACIWAARVARNAMAEAIALRPKPRPNLFARMKSAAGL